GRYLYPILEGPLLADTNQNRRFIYQFDTKTKSYTGTVYQYRVDNPSYSIGDMTELDNNRFLVIERDQNQGAAAAFKRIYLGDRRDVSADGFLVKHEVVDLMHMNDPSLISLPGKPGDIGLGNPFTFPFVTIEDVLPLGHNRLLVINDNN